MRPIKFRAWHIGFKEMGYLDYLWNNHWYSTPSGPSPDRGKVLFDNNNSWMSNHARGGRDLILMQFTGFHDKSGREIYEGDFLKDTDSGEVGKVIWDARETCFTSQFDDNSRWGFVVNSQGKDSHCEVIGNRFENPELLKEAL